MNFISLGISCGVPEGIKKSNLRERSYPFDWLWSPSKTTYDIINILLNIGVDEAVEYMTTGYTYYKYNGNESYTSVNNITTCQMNKHTGLGNTHFTIDEHYKIKLKRRLERLLTTIKSLENIVFIYSDAGNPKLNYILDDIEYGLEATEYLLKIYDLIYPLNNNIKILYFCWNERKKENNNIQYIPFNYNDNYGGGDVAVFISDYLYRLQI